MDIDAQDIIALNLSRAVHQYEAIESVVERELI
jgi:hypothetical protein